MEFCSWEVCSVIEEKWECGCGKGWRNGVWILATVDLNCSIKLLNYQILPLIDFPKPSASGWANLKAMRLSTWSELFFSFFFLTQNIGIFNGFVMNKWYICIHFRNTVLESLLQYMTKNTAGIVVCYITLWNVDYRLYQLSLRLLARLECWLNSPENLYKKRLNSVHQKKKNPSTSEKCSIWGVNYVLELVYH